MNPASKLLRAVKQRAQSYRLRRDLINGQLFSPTWYLAAYPDVAAAGIDPYTHYVEFGWREGRNPSLNFNTNDYLTANPDVQKAGLNPLLHYWQHGMAEGRFLKTGPFRGQTYRRLIPGEGQAAFTRFERKAVAAAPDHNLPESFSVAFLIGCLEGESKRYRVFNVIEALKLRNVSAAHFVDIDIPSQLETILSHDLIVLFRYPWSRNVEQLIERARDGGVPIVFDVDDYIFDPGIAAQVDGVRMLPEEEKALYLDGVLRYRKCLANSDYATAPTGFLASMEIALAPKSYVVLNTINDEQLRIYQEVAADLAAKQHSAPREEIVLGYFSGTLTHQKDFEQAYPALVRILTEHPQVKLLIKGAFKADEFPALATLGDRLILLPLSNWKELPWDIAKVDINLIPLEASNLFCEAKSELKYFESAILGIPSVASEVGPYKEAIEHGENGMLVRTAEDWYTCLNALVTDSELRQRLGQNARAHVEKHYVPENLARNADAVYRDILDDYRRQRIRRAKQKKFSVSFIAPCPKPGSGGHKDIFLLSNVLAELGHEVNIYFLPDIKFASVTQVEEQISSHFVEPKFNCILGTDVALCDALIATHFSTAYYVSELLAKAKKSFYFVQDYEPYFYPVNEEYVRAARTYSMGHSCITLGNWLQEILKRRHGCEAQAIPFWLERDIYYPRPEAKGGKPRIAFLARPEMPRRCFNLGVEALRLFHEAAPNVEILLFGSTETKAQKLPFKHTDLGVVNKARLGELYAGLRAGLAFAPTNPSFVPYEMMASGCPVVDISMDNEFDYLKYGSADNAVLLPPDPESIANALRDLVDNEARRASLTANAYQFVNNLPSVEKAGEKFAAILHEGLAKL